MKKVLSECLWGAGTAGLMVLAYNDPGVYRVLVFLYWLLAGMGVAGGLLILYAASQCNTEDAGDAVIERWKERALGCKYVVHVRAALLFVFTCICVYLGWEEAAAGMLLYALVSLALYLLAKELG